MIYEIVRLRSPGRTGPSRASAGRAAVQSEAVRTATRECLHLLVDIIALMVASSILLVSYGIMASSISIRVYRLHVQRRGNRKKLSFDPSEGGIALPTFVSKFISDCSTTTEDKDRERSWYFEQKASVASGTNKGVVHYGTHGFESDLVDGRTRKSRYRRQVTDSEVIPLYYEYWYPAKSRTIFAVFQSFQGRSCVTMVMSKMQEIFEAENPAFLLRYKKLIPNDSAGSIYKNFPVQKLTLIKRNVSSDVADQYIGTRPGEPVNLEISLVARRKGNVGLFGTLARQIKPNETGVLLQGGLKFDEATANVRVGGRTRAVGVFGANSEAGVIDLSDSVERGENGHPKFASIANESGKILADFHSMLDSASED